MQKNVYPCLHLQILFSEIQQNIEFFYVFPQKQLINLEKIPLTIQIFALNGPLTFLSYLQMKKKNCCVILIIKVFMTDFR